MSPILMMAADGSLAFTSTVVIAGVSIVLGVLVLLIFIFYLFGFIVSKTEQRAKAKKAKKQDVITAPVKPVAPPVKPITTPAVQKAPAVEQGISGEVVAAITAAIVATEGPTAVVRSIKKKNVGSRNPWAQAAMTDNTRPF